MAAGSTQKKWTHAGGAHGRHRRARRLCQGARVDEKDIRDKAVRNLRRWLSKQRSGAVKELDFLKV